MAYDLPSIYTSTSTSILCINYVVVFTQNYFVPNSYCESLNKRSIFSSINLILIGFNFRQRQRD